MNLALAFRKIDADATALAINVTVITVDTAPFACGVKSAATRAEGSKRTEWDTRVGDVSATLKDYGKDAWKDSLEVRFRVRGIRPQNPRRAGRRSSKIWTIENDSSRSRPSNSSSSVAQTESPCRSACTGAKLSRASTFSNTQRMHV